MPIDDDVDASIVRLGLWSLFAAAAVVRNPPGIDPLRPNPADDAALIADRLLQHVATRWPELGQAT